MSYNLYINSTVYHPSTISAANVSQRVYGVDWSFLPNNTKFKVTFKFATGRGQLNPNDTGYIVMNLNNSSNVTSLTSLVEYQSTNMIGFLFQSMRAQDHPQVFRQMCMLCLTRMKTRHLF